MTGFARVDLWGGNHFFLQKPVGLGSGIGGLLISVLLLYAFTFLTNLAVGRFFCGWGCPVSYLNRLGEEIEITTRRKDRLYRNLLGASYSAVFAGSLVIWFIDPYLVFTQPWSQVATAGIVFLALVGATYFHARYWRWSFCRCAPVGLIIPSWRSTKLWDPVRSAGGLHRV
jgi:polyferredoxin